MYEISRRAFVTTAGLALLGLSGCGQNSVEQGSTTKNEPVNAEVNESKPSDLQVTESGFYMDQYGHLGYAAIIENTNSQWAAENIQVSVGARDSSGSVVDSTTDHITLLFANGSTAVCGDMFPNSEVSSVDFQVSVQKNNWSKEDLQMEKFASALPVIGTNEAADEFGSLKISGEVQNDTKSTFALPRVNIVLRDEQGAIVGGVYTYLDGDFAPGTKLPFTANISDPPAHAFVEAYLDCGWPVSE